MNTEAAAARPTILAVDDDPGNLAILGRLLHPHYNVLARAQIHLDLKRAQLAAGPECFSRSRTGAARSTARSAGAWPSAFTVSLQVKVTEKADARCSGTRVGAWQ